MNLRRGKHTYEILTPRLPGPDMVCLAWKFRFLGLAIGELRERTRGTKGAASKWIKRGELFAGFDIPARFAGAAGRLAALRAGVRETEMRV